MCAISPPSGDFSEPVTSHTKRYVKAFWALYPNQKPTGGDEATNIRNAAKIMDARFNKYLDFDDQMKDGDKVFEDNGVKVVVDKPARGP